MNGVPMRADVNFETKDIRRAVRELKQLEGNVLQTMRRDLKKALATQRAQIAKSYPTSIGRKVLRGMRHEGRTATSGKRSIVTFHPGKPRGKAWKHIAAIEINPSPSDRVGIYLAELAGSRTKGITPQGRHLIQRLNEISRMKGKGGRFFYTSFRGQSKEIYNITKNILNQLLERIEKKI